MAGGIGGGGSRDGFGWEYYVGRYDGLGRRRRRWVRNLKRMSIAAAPSADKADAKKRKLLGKTKPFKEASAKATTISSSTTTSASKTKTTYHHPNIFRSIQDQYSFKGFGYSFYKSLVRTNAFGASLRVPLSANFDRYDSFLFLPYVSSAVYCGYPWMIANFYSASVPLEAVRWVVGSMVWKVWWMVAVISACVRGFVDSVVWVVLGPWRVWRMVLQLMANLACRIGFQRRKEGNGMVVDAIVADGYAATTKSNETDSTPGISDEGLMDDVNIETHIAINNSSEYTATAIVDSPRGGATTNTTIAATNAFSSPSFRKKRLTMLGNEIPTFQYPKSIEYSSTIQERIGVAVSWRISQEHGYEYRCHFVYTCLPTLLFWGRLGEERRRRMEVARGRYAGIWGKRREGISSTSAKRNNINMGTSIACGDKVEGKEVIASESKSLSTSDGNHRFLRSFLSDHSSTMGFSSGFPQPFHPYFSLNLMLSLSGFYYGWLLKYIRSLFVLPTTKKSPLLTSGSGHNGDATIKSSVEKKNEKLVSSALKNKKLPLDVEGEDMEVKSPEEKKSEKLVSSALKNKKLPLEGEVDAEVISSGEKKSEKLVSSALKNKKLPSEEEEYDTDGDCLAEMEDDALLVNSAGR